MHPCENPPHFLPDHRIGRVIIIIINVYLVGNYHTITDFYFICATNN